MIPLIFFSSSFLCRSLLSIPVGWKQHAREPCKELHASKQHPLASLHLPLPSPPAPSSAEGVFHQSTWLKGQDVLQQVPDGAFTPGKGRGVEPRGSAGMGVLSLGYVAGSMGQLRDGRKRDKLYPAARESFPCTLTPQGRPALLAAVKPSKVVSH